MLSRSGGTHCCTDTEASLVGGVMDTEASLVGGVMDTEASLVGGVRKSGGSQGGGSELQWGGQGRGRGFGTLSALTWRLGGSHRFWESPILTLT